MTISRCPHCMTELTEDTKFCTYCGKKVSDQNEAHQLKCGTVLNGRYYVGRCLGQGGFGITYIGHDSMLDLTVAIKEYYPMGIVNRHHEMTEEVTSSVAEAASFEQGKKRFLEEARTLAQFTTQPNVVTVRDVFSLNNTAYMVMEYLEGKSLQDYIKEKGRLSFDETVHLLMPIIKVLEKIHAKGLIHRDISPANIMLLNNGIVKLLDFGAARDYTDGEKSLSVVLKPGYAPEEQFRSHGDQGPWTDVYALCATIYRMITCRVPENSINRLYHDPLQRPSELGAIITQQQEAVLLKGMAVLASDRYRSMTELLSDLLNTDGSTVAVQNPGFYANGKSAPQTSMSGASIQKPSAQASKPQSAAQQAAPVAVSADSEKSVMIPVHERDEIRKQANVQQSAGRRPQQSFANAPQQASQLQAPQEDFFAGVELTEEVPKETKKKNNKKKAAGNANGTAPSADTSVNSPADKPAKKKKKGKIWLTIIPVLLVVIGVAIAFSVGDSHKAIEIGASGEYAYVRDTTVTTSDISYLDGKKKVETIYFTDCTITPEVLKRIGSMKRIKSIDFRNCTGIFSIDELASLSTLERLKFDEKSTFNPHVLPVDGSVFLTKEMPNLKAIEFNCIAFVSGTEFLHDRLPGLEHFTADTCQGVTDLSFLADAADTLKWIDVYTTDLSECDLSGWDKLSTLIKVNLDTTGVPNVSFVSGMTGLHDLRVIGGGVTTLAPLAGAVPDLSTLTVNGCPLKTLDGVENHEKLVNVYLSYNQLENVSALASCPGITHLDLDGNLLTQEAVDALAPLTGMKELYINQQKDIYNLDFCLGMLDLVEISAQKNKIVSIDGLSNSTQIEKAVFSANQLTDISVLAKSIAHLERVQIADNQITDISPLLGAVNLIGLTCENNQLTTLHGLEQCPGLNYLSAHGNMITDISALSNSHVLRYVDLGENQISDISALAGLTEESGTSYGVAWSSDSVALLLQNNQITDLSPLVNSCKYRGIVLYGNPITDLSALKELTYAGGCKYYLGYDAAIDFADLADSEVAGNFFDDIVIVDCPLDQRAELKNTWENVKKGDSYSYFGAEMEFVEKQEADLGVLQWRIEIGEDAAMDQASADLAGLDEETYQALMAQQAAEEEAEGAEGSADGDADSSDASGEGSEDDPDAEDGDSSTEE